MTTTMAPKNTWATPQLEPLQGMLDDVALGGALANDGADVFSSPS